MQPDQVNDVATFTAQVDGARDDRQRPVRHAGLTSAVKKCPQRQCGRPPPKRPTRLRRAVRWDREESRHRLDAEKRGCGGACPAGSTPCTPHHTYTYTYT